MGVLADCRWLLLVFIFWQIPWTQAQQEGTQAFPVRFKLQQDDIVAFTGGANTVTAQENSYLETLLTLSSPQKNVRFRNMAWEGDTVFEQRREMNFGSWREQFSRVGVTVVFAQFGQMESLQGKSVAPQFILAYEKLLDEFARQTQRMVLLSPIPFEKPPPPLPDLSLRNDDLRVYVEAIRDLARKRSYLYLDLFTPFVEPARKGLHLTDNGVQLTAAGHWIISEQIARKLGFGQTAERIHANTAAGALRPDSAEHLRQIIKEKNRLWFDYWRPMNWAFLHGDRISQPSSRDHRDPNIRWFPEEMGKFLPLIEAKEKEIATLAEGVVK